ncbi:MAG: DUF4097 family beta strand repeat protein, partial [Sedimentisphaerales bacterium]|nr:DUF4097 family beta strand repeat protein [Sedimentisphaerales bacterium]
IDHDTMNLHTTGEDKMTSPQSMRSVLMGLCVLSFATMGGCIIYTSGGGSNQEQYKRTVSEQVARDAIASLDVDTTFGSITVTGADVDGIAVTAEIIGRAPSEEEAQELAEQTQIKIEPVGNTLRVRADKPETRNNRSVSVSYTITTPKPMSVTCRSSYGAVRVTGTAAAADVKTSNGSINIEAVRGEVKADTSYGTITCTDAVGQQVALRSNNGSITARRIEGSTGIESSYGSVTCDGFSGPELRIKTGNGRITVSGAKCGTCDIDTSYGAIACSALTSDSLKLHSNNGTVDLYNVQAESMDLSSSYGAIKARQVTTPRITAQSGNGSIEIVCSGDCPPDLNAKATSGYGSITLTAPPQFSGQVHLSTHYGSVGTALPVTVSGKIDKKNITGQIGNGAGSIDLQTNNGSIELKQNTIAIGVTFSCRPQRLQPGLCLEPEQTHFRRRNAQA